MLDSSIKMFLQNNKQQIGTINYTSGQPTDGAVRLCCKGAFSVHIRLIYIKNVGQGDGGSENLCIFALDF